MNYDEHDMMQESILFPWIDDPSYDVENYEPEWSYDSNEDENEEDET
jgi:hypothetical protein